MSHEVFISHSSKDKTLADAVCATLETAGIRCWIAPRDIKSGQKWPEAITGAIAKSRVMVLIFTDNSNNSGEVANELTLAVKSGAIVVPFKLDDIVPQGTLEYYLAGTHWLEAMNPPTEKQLQYLVETVKTLLDSEAVQPLSLNTQDSAAVIIPGGIPAKQAIPEADTELVERPADIGNDRGSLEKNPRLKLKSKKALIISAPIIAVVLAGLLLFFSGVFDRDTETIPWRDGTYTGTLKDGIPHGHGTWVHPDGDQYQGEYSYGMEHGQGTITAANGEEYSGEFYEGLPHGKGTYTHPNGEKYTGDFVEGSLTGTGTYTWPSGETYSGEWLDFMKHGQGSWSYPNGETYVGQWKMDLPHGWGIWTNWDGEQYEGEWQYGLEHGYGILTLSSGEKFEGLWVEGEFVETLNDYEPNNREHDPDMLLEDSSPIESRKTGPRE